jgi:hypothetical protein
VVRKRLRVVDRIAPAERQPNRSAAEFYARCLTETDCQDLAQAAALEGVDAEIAVLRVMIQQDLSRGKLTEARRDIDALCRTLKVQYALDDRSTDNLSQALARVLDEIGNELGMAL